MTVQTSGNPMGFAPSGIFRPPPARGRLTRVCNFLQDLPGRASFSVPEGSRSVRQVLRKALVFTPVHDRG